jgi:hypothetical protein
VGELGLAEQADLLVREIGGEAQGVEEAERAGAL